MALPCHVYIEDQGMVGEDDGTAAWTKTLVSVLVAGGILDGYLLRDGYSGQQLLRIVNDDFGLDGSTAHTLLLRVYGVSSSTMRTFSCDTGEAYLDLERLIRGLFSKAMAENLVRQMRSAARCGSLSAN